MLGTIATVAVLALATGGTSVAAEPVTVETLLSLEAIGQTRVDPTGHRIAVERLRPQASLPRYDLGYVGTLRYAELMVGDVTTGEALVPLLAQPADAGDTLGEFSPDGRRLAFFRLQADSWRLGIIELETGSVIWTDVAPLPAIWGRTLAWTSDRQLVVLGTSNSALPREVAQDRRVQTELSERWAAAARGEASFVVNEAGPERSPPAHPPDTVLWAVDASTGRVRPLATGNFTDLELSPDGRTVAVVMDGPSEQLAAGGPVEEVRRRRELALVTLSTGDIVRVGEDIEPTLLTWSSSGDELLVYSRAVAQGFARVSLGGTVTSVSTGSVNPSVPLIDGIGHVPRAAWLERDPVIFGHDADGIRSDWWRMASDGPINLTASLEDPGRLEAEFDDRLVIRDGDSLVMIAADGQIRRLGDTGPTPPSSVPPPVRALFGALKPGAVLFSAAGLVCRLTETVQHCGPARGEPVLNVDRSGGVLSYESSRAGSDQLTLRPDASSTPQALMALNTELERIDFPEPIHVQGPDGASGWLYLPEGAAPHPVVAIPYPGRVRSAPPEEMRRGARSAMWTGQLLVASGYAVLYPDLPAQADPSDRLADRILRVVDAAASNAPIDKERIGLLGWSFGAWASVMSATQSDRFQAVVALNGPYDRLSVLGTTSLRARLDGRMQTFATDNARWLETGQAGLGKTYWQEPEAYMRNSAVAQADRITAPVLILSGDMDFGVSQGEILFGALNRLNRRASLITFFGEDHGFVSPGNIREMHARTISWFDRYLKAVSDVRPTSTASDAPTPRQAPD